MFFCHRRIQSPIIVLKDDNVVFEKSVGKGHLPLLLGLAEVREELLEARGLGLVRLRPAGLRLLLRRLRLLLQVRGLRLRHLAQLSREMLPKEF